ncbi:hypothetical protein [Actinomyces minihominis]|uniref:hypothetical protein n=1 Tax=Actinomyces minihominis TaxID=2002838 RepID=UPI000C08794B|nr:hypothetical protein [Actinomyces minihominis]
MTRSLQVRRGVERLKTGLIYGAGGLVVLGVGLGLLMPGSPWLSVIIGVVIGAVMLATSWFTTSKTVAAVEPSVVWIALDFGIKVVVTVVALVAAKNFEQLDVTVVAILLIAAIAISSIVQVLAFAPRKRQAVPTETEN